MHRRTTLIPVREISERGMKSFQYSEDWVVYEDFSTSYFFRVCS